jgi:hypothetical protein
MTTGNPRKAPSIYIAGPMTDIPDFNFPAFNRVAAKLRGEGFDVTNPAELHSHTHMPWEFYMRSALRAMLDCEMIYMLVGWSSSRGACLELDIARKLGFAVMYECDEQVYEHKR